MQRIKVAESLLGDKATHSQNAAATVVEEEESYSKATTGYCGNTELTKLLGIIWG